MQAAHVGFRADGATHGAQRLDALRCNRGAVLEGEKGAAK
jgi:hypothetical protein